MNENSTSDKKVRAFNMCSINEIREYILHDIAAQIMLSFNHVIKEPWILISNSRKKGFSYGQINFTSFFSSLFQEYYFITLVKLLSDLDPTVRKTGYGSKLL